MSTKHTPGPWRSFNKFGNRGGCFGADGKTLVCHLPNRLPNDRHITPPPEEANANFRLIDAAPRMLADLKDLLDLAERHGLRAYEMENARAAIAKAEGTMK